MHTNALTFLLGPLEKACNFPLDSAILLLSRACEDLFIAVAAYYITCITC